MVLFPIGAWAVTGSNVFVTDATSGVHAAVNSGGQLNVTGPATAAPALTYNHSTVVIENGNCFPLNGPLPAGKALVIAMVTVTVASVTTGPVSVEIGRASGTGACAGSPLNATALADTGATEFIPFPSGLDVKNGHSLGISVTSLSHDASTTVSAHGYLVPATQCQSGTGGPTGCY
jgi:hypothetical protein